MTELDDIQEQILLENGLVNAKKVDKKYFDYVRSDNNFDLFNAGYYDCEQLLNYLSKKQLDDYLFVSNGFYAFVLFDIDSLTLIQLVYIKDDFKVIDSYIKQFNDRMIKQMNPLQVVNTTDKAYKIMILRLLLISNKVEDEGKRKVALSAYQHSEYHFADFDFKKLFLETKNNAEDLNKLHSKELGSIIKIWRGVSSKSSNLEDALGWTLSKDIALKFAKRFNTDDGNDHLYSSFVDGKDVLAYIDAEEEILVDYNDLTSIEEEDI
ncbi:hypothetical protein [Companilactobacillus insicii]|uniref:hypothetical protein n=1 Tax=Companilactobacillus insicii TaxID=1732567 RepID=UPI000F78DBFF|nr:hypothetical protein [Companilactobacillus insicii]